LIAQMSRDAIEAGLGWSWRPTRVVAAIRDPSTLAIAIGRPSLAGFCIMEFGDQSAHLSLLAVEPTRRRRGLGRALVEWMLASARVAGVEAIHVEMRSTNLHARAFYRALRFQDAGIVAGYYRGKESALRMVLRLRAKDLPDVTWEPPIAWRRPADS
jgi:ribosomal protein S18 acetylase RimI-like enzyme